MWFQKKTDLNKKNKELYNAYRHISHAKYLCHAPFKSLYIGMDGVITPCCYNRWYVLGTYPHQQLDEI